MIPTFIPVLFFVLTAFLLLRNGVRKMRWTIDDEMLRVRGVIEKRMVPEIMRYFRSISRLALCIVIGSYEMSNRIAWWALAGLLVLLSLGGLVVSRFSTYQELKTELIPEEDALEKTVRTKIESWSCLSCGSCRVVSKRLAVLSDMSGSERLLLAAISTGQRNPKRSVEN